MAVNLKVPDSLLPVPGIRLGVAAAGIRKPGRHDLLLIELAAGSRAAGVFTRNAFSAAPVRVAREHLAGGMGIRALLVNSGNANAGTGSAGLEDARACARAVAQRLGCEPQAVLPFSTGVIGERLPVARLLDALPAVVADLAPEGWMKAMRAIMTTDTLPKGVSRQLDLGGRRVTVTGIAKGAGMIRPDMATMLAFIATDAAVAQPALQDCLREAVEPSFNSITVDGDTSTNDACLLLASGAAGNAELDGRHPDYPAFRAAVTEVCTLLAQAIVRDGEGATRFITVAVEQARDTEEARRVAYAVAQSPLVKTAWFAGDPNWGRILAAVGNSGVEDLAIEQVQVWLDDVQVVRDGGLHPDYREAAGAAVFRQPEFTVRIRLGRGAVAARVWTCDFSYDYVKINAEYRS